MLSMTTATIIGSNAVRALDVNLALSAPTNICGESGLSSVDLSWDTPTDINVTGHVVEYQTYGAASWTAGPTITAVNAVTVPGTNGVRYSYRVASTNNSGQRSAWGSYCLLGWGQQNSSSVPMPINRSTLDQQKVTNITAGDRYTCAVTSDGTAACWGNNDYGQLGDGTTYESSEPIVVTGGALTGKTVTNITAGGNINFSVAHTCAVTSDGGAACWGSGESGQLGNGATTTTSNTPVAVTGGALTGKTVTKISAGDGHTCALTSGGTAACWGVNFAGQLGNGTTTNSSTPLAVTGGALTGKTVTKITASGFRTCAVLSDGSVACWGSGDGTTTTSATPVAVTGGALTGKTATNITAGDGHTCALTSDGTAACWGNNQYGQLGDGTTNNSFIPVAVTGGALTGKTVANITTAGSIGLGCAHTCAVTSDGGGACWGSGESGQLGNGTTTNSTTPVAITADALTGKTVTKSNVTVTFQTPSGDPVVGSSVTWRTVDGTKRGKKAVVTGSDGKAKFAVINTGPVIFALDGGRVGTSATKISSASLTGVIAKSGTSNTVTLPSTPSVVTRTITTSMPDGAPVPGVALNISGGVSGSTSTGVATFRRLFTTSWNYDGWIGNNTTADANGVLTFTGFQVPSVGRDVIATFSDGEIEQEASGSLESATTNLVFDQMPVVQMIVDTETYFEPGKPVTVTVIAVDGTGDPISGTSINLAAVTVSASALSTAFLNAAERHPSASSCKQKLSAKTKANGRVTLTLCPTTTKAWRADGTNIVASKPSTVRVKSAPGAPAISKVAATSGKITVTFTAPSSTG